MEQQQQQAIEHQKHLNLITALQNPHYNPEDDNYKMILPIILECDFFNRFFPTTDNLNEFAKLAKYSLNYEVHPYGTVLVKEKEYVDRFYIILQGDVLRFHQKQNSEVQKELKEKRRRRSSIDKGSITRLSRAIRIGSESPTHTTGPGNLINPIAVNFLGKMQKTAKSSTRQLKLNSVLAKEPKESEEPHVMVRGHKRPSTLLGGSSDRNGPQRSSKILEADEIQGGVKRTSQIERASNYLERRSSHLDGIKGSARESLMALAQVQEEEGLIKFISSKNTEIKDRCMIEGVVRVAKNKTYSSNEYFGENFCKAQQPKESSLYVVSSSEVHLLTLSKENFKRIMKELEEQGDGKLQLFLALFPSFDRSIVKEFSEFFSEQCFHMNELIYSQNEPIEDLYLVQSGEVKLYKDFDSSPTNAEPQTPSKKAITTLHMPRGNEIPVVSIIRNQLFGEERLLKMQTRQYTAVAYHPNTTVYVLKSKLHKRIKVDFEFMFEALRTGAVERFAWREHKAVELMEQHKLMMNMNHQPSPFHHHSKSIGSPKSLGLGLHRGLSHTFNFSEATKNFSSFMDQDGVDISVIQRKPSIVLERKASVEEALHPVQKLEHYKSHFSRKISLISPINTSTSSNQGFVNKTEHLPEPPVKDSFMEFSVRKELGDLIKTPKMMKSPKNLLQLNLTKKMSKASNHGSLNSLNSPLTPLTPAAILNSPLLPYTPGTVKISARYLLKDDFKLPGPAKANNGNMNEGSKGSAKLPKLNGRTQSELIGVVNISLESLIKNNGGALGKGMPPQKIKAKKFAPIHKLPF